MRKDQNLKDFWSIQLPEMTPRKPKCVVPARNPATLGAYYLC